MLLLCITVVATPGGGRGEEEGANWSLSFLTNSFEGFFGTVKNQDGF